MMNIVGEFDGYWDPENIRCVDELRNEIKQVGDNFWGDHLILQLIQKKTIF